MTDTVLGQPSGPARGATAPPGAEVSGGPGSLPPDRGPRRRSRPRLRLWAVALVLAGALVFLLVEGLGSSLDYFETVDQALAHRAALGTSNFRLEGVVLRGSVRPTSVGTDFTLAQGDRTIQVHNVGSPPGLFQPGIPVVVVGHFAPGVASTFDSDQIMVKHSADYIAQHPGRVRASNGSVR